MGPEKLLKEQAASGSLRAVIKPNSPRTEVLGFSEGWFRIAVAAPPKEGKANLELVRFLSKLLGKGVKIKSGLSSRKKLIQVLD